MAIVLKRLAIDVRDDTLYSRLAADAVARHRRYWRATAFRRRISASAHLKKRRVSRASIDAPNT